MDSSSLLAAGSYDANALSFVTAFASAAILILGSAILLRGRGVAASVRFFLITLFAAGWLAADAAMYAALRPDVALVWARTGFALGALIPAALFHFAVDYVGRRRRHRLTVPLIWIGCAAVGVTGALTGQLIPAVRRFAWGYYAAGKPHGGAIVLGFAAIIVASVHLFRTVYRTSEGKAKERAGLLLLAFVLGSTAMFDYIPSAGVNLQPVGYLSALAFVVVATTALWRFELGDITPEYAAAQILDTMTGAVLVVDMRGNIRVANRGVEKLLGYKASELRGAHIRTILQRDQNLNTAQLLSSVGVLEHTMAWRSAAGATVDVLVSSSFLRNEDGAPVGVVYVASDFTERKRAEDELRRSEERYRELFENANDLVYTHDLEGRITSVNVAGERLTGYSRDEVLGTPIHRLIVPEHVERAKEAMAKKLAGEAASTFYEVDVISKDGRRIPLEISTRLIHRDGRPVGVQGIGRDITDRRDNEARYRVLFERNLAGVYRTTVDGKILDCNDACARIFGFASREDLLAATATDFYFEDLGRERVLQLLREQGSLSNLELRLRRRDGTTVWVLENVTLLDGILEGTMFDITDRKLAQEQVEYHAYHDALTGLPNRLLFRDRITVALAHAKRNGRRSAVMFLDLDQFKLVNDTLGHTVGDRLLQAIGARLISCVRGDDTVARMGGDEFTILLSDLVDRRGAAAVAQKVLDSVQHPIQIDDHELYVTTSVGIAVFPDDGDDAESLLRNADRAMYRAKELGRNNVQYATPENDAAADERLALEQHLRHGVERGELELHYQPMLEIATGRLVGAEALLRWNHPERGLMQPEEFIHIAEETQLIVPIGAWVLRTACAQMKQWHALGHPRLRLAVNLSPRQFQDVRLISTIERTLAETELPPSLLDLEITESTAMQNAELSVSILTRLKQMGVRIAIDDFGTGYSSLSYLKRFPIDTVKIDRGFVRDLTKDDAAIISAVISMARALELRTVAEGVETQEQLDFLRREQCSEMQGFLYSEPLPAERFAQTLITATHPPSPPLLRPFA